MGEEAGNQNFSFMYVKLKVPIKHLSGNVKKAVGNTTTELRMETWDQKYTLESKGLWTVFKAMRGGK